MESLQALWYYLKQFPEYLPAFAAALGILILGVPVYMGIWYFIYRRKLLFPWDLRIGLLGVFVMFAGLAFAFASPFARHIQPLLKTYMFLTSVVAAYCIVALLDIFIVQYYLMEKRKIYVSPPLRKVINLSVFCLSLLPILHFVLKFNPFTLIAIPTIATAGVALALQDTMKAFIAGVGLGRLIRLGDWIGFQDKEGRVVDINWGRTVLRTIDGDLLFVPNNLLMTQPFMNFSTHRSHRMTFKVNAAGTAPPERVKQAMKQCAENLQGLVKFPEVVAQVSAMPDGVVSYALYYWIEDYGQRLDIQDQLAGRIWEAFRKEGFEMAFPFPTYTLEEGFHPPLAAVIKKK
jgi:small-conductance mechanosensitive channel